MSDDTRASAAAATRPHESLAGLSLGQVTPEQFGTPGPLRPADPPPPGRGLGGGQVLDRRLPFALLLVCAAVSSAVLAVFGAWSPTAAVALTAVVYVVGVYVLTRAVEGPRRALDRVVTALVTIAFVLAMAPLVSLVYTVVSLGADRFDLAFFTQTMQGVLGEGGGFMHAIVGTLIVTAIAAAVSVPLGIMAAIYLVEYGTGRLKQTITFLVDVMTGIPSIVAGLFAFALFSTLLGDPGHRSGIAGAIALSVLMTPVVIRSCEEMLKLVPDELREASYALGVPKWRTITKIVLPTSLAGIATGVTISIARVIGETAPLLITLGFTTNLNLNPFDGRMSTLPVLTYYSYAAPGVPPDPSIARAWTAALVLILIVMVLNGVARLVSYLFAPKTGR